MSLANLLRSKGTYEVSKAALEAKSQSTLDKPQGGINQLYFGGRMKSEISVQPISDDLIEGYHRALDIVARERRFLTMLEAPPLAETRKFVIEMIESNNPMFVACDGGEVSGWCDIRRHHFPSHAHRGTLGMGLIPACRRRGIGRQLVDAALSQAWKSGFSRVELNVHGDNEAAITLYEKTGFVREGVLKNASLIDGQYRSAIAMAILNQRLTRVV